MSQQSPSDSKSIVSTESETLPSEAVRESIVAECSARIQSIDLTEMAARSDQTLNVSQMLQTVEQQVRRLWAFARLRADDAELPHPPPEPEGIGNWAAARNAVGRLRAWALRSTVEDAAKRYSNAVTKGAEQKQAEANSLANLAEREKPVIELKRAFSSAIRAEIYPDCSDEQFMEAGRRWASVGILLQQQGYASQLTEHAQTVPQEATATAMLEGNAARIAENLSALKGDARALENLTYWMRRTWNAWDKWRCPVTDAELELQRERSEAREQFLNSPLPETSAELREEIARVRARLAPTTAKALYLLEFAGELVERYWDAMRSIGGKVEKIPLRPPIENCTRSAAFVDLIKGKSQLYELQAAIDVVWNWCVGESSSLTNTQTAQWITDWKDILGALGLKRDDKRRLQRLHKRYDGPIRVSRPKGKPLVDKSALLAWWNGLEQKVEQTTARTRDAAATVAEQHQYGRTGRVAPDISGSIRSRRKAN